MNRTYDVIVAGAGPAGTAAARTCAEAGLSTLCLEEHGTIGYPVQCAGLLSTIAFEECRISRRCILHSVSGARVRSSLGNEVLIDAGVTKAHVVDRGILDLEMAEAAADAGADFRTKTAVCGLGDRTVRTRGVHRLGEYRYRLLIAADGPRSVIARLRNMERARVYLAGIQADVPYEMDGRVVELYPDASPEFFGWAIPIGKERARIGLCGLSNVKERFFTFQEMFGGSCIHFVTGTLPLGVMPRTFGDRTLYVGDAAGFAKPTSGGGVFTGVRSARHAAATAIECCEAGSFSDARLSAYERRWKADIGKELATGMRLWYLRQRMTPEDIDALCRVLDDPGVLQLIREYGDMDRPSALVKRLCMKPVVFRLLGIILRSGVCELRK